MHITRDLLVKFAREYVAKKTRQSNDIVAVYLTGSVLTDDPLIGGSTDIDLVVVHKENPLFEREVQRISYEISLDVQHHHQSFYTFHRRLRLNPWLGFALCDHRSILYDTEHWLEFIQAGVSAGFNSPETVYARGQAAADKARQLWFELEDPQELPFALWTDLYYKAVGSAANAIAIINGPALTTRRMLLDFPARAEALGKLELTGELLQIISRAPINTEILNTWRPVWENALSAASKLPDCPPNLLPARKAYFVNSCAAMLESGSAHAALWPMVETWRQANLLLSEDPAQQEAWQKFLEALEITPFDKDEQIERLDLFLDNAEAALAEMKAEYGL
ncbi:MAG TPA: hypothetical protein PKL60_00100 [Anaerolineaceae bacterium]|nr:hypothetical protein [Anaerolineaceae bacterium]